ncbi:Multidrug resistance protein MdtA [Aliiroseovarius sp. xm-m-379]|uniref:efflux RND transporter periplasmic adaptor subunit n=1 Tax=unclassified Aliiroseovarius TaxID=2623558 RepID=UPI001568004D|nr:MULTISPECIES: efflux RND transporter periplasmic adaptor subunit [unclassified Aliiroseovarius]NRP14002.1 Multidrug resistance protein MdtA [Aliiroseovarius sp. xm-d-517]NRP23486.1 Multidrug resistance protein MdtA [Aliiroseovarius sp. xm-m-379]NRP29268.1 Multidrug resistance protein MdtA [Aliiroseovarius sp. xm-m-314]NRP32285.1 Multidrug resistance protein MdtA [Aliiroseovarius sp. xm-a-104]NRP40818.1 Multidrug resistance protein MdtA [Aliiroseovarius sp. xm-m-339-2]
MSRVFALSRLVLSLPLLVLPTFVWAELSHTVTPVSVPDWKAVFGKVEPRDNVPARSRLGGTVVDLRITEGDQVAEGQVLATIWDEKLDLRLRAVDASLTSLNAQLENAESELKRAENLMERGVVTTQRLDALRTQVDVVKGQIAATQAERQVIEQQAAEGAVIAPIAGRVLQVPVTRGAVVMPGEVVAQIGGGGVYLRLAIPERHTAFLTEGAEIQIGTDNADKTGADKTGADRTSADRTGRLVKIYPQIENGRVIADVEVAELDARFVNARVLVRLPVGQSEKLLVPVEAAVTRMGLDFVTIRRGDTPVERAVVLGDPFIVEGQQMVEVLTGLNVGDVVIDPIPPAAGAGAGGSHE